MKIKLKIQSISDIITNSSSEIFCAIKSDKNTIIAITEYLQSLGCRFGSWEDDNMIIFDTPYGEGDSGVEESFIPILRELLNKQFGKENYEIITDVQY